MNAPPGSHDAVTSAPLFVARVVEDNTHVVVIGPGENRRHQLRRELKAAYLHGGINDLLIVAGSPEFSIMSDRALDRLLALREVRQACDVTIDPLAADRFAAAVDEASQEPARCGSCGEMVDHDGPMCGPCGDAQDRVDDRIANAHGRAS